VNEETEPLTQFQDFYHASTRRPGFTDQSFYAQLRAAFYAGYAARPRPPLEPSRDALAGRNSILRRYAPPQPWKDGSADYIQHDSIRGYLPTREPLPETMKRRNPVAAPDPATLARIHDKLRADGIAEYPVSDETMDFPAVTRADTALMPAQPSRPGLEPFEWGMWGAPGPVPTPVEGEDAAS
jgi:hypothetical protein